MNVNEKLQVRFDHRRGVNVAMRNACVARASRRPIVRVALVRRAAFEGVGSLRMRACVVGRRAASRRGIPESQEKAIRRRRAIIRSRTRGRRGDRFNF
ncbi:hypothetical protein WS91_19255 [Burkholderia sp. MSMB1498]|nr:hypothetical protein WS91_19255 [Burkholderia sp. MSMB1498]